MANLAGFDANEVEPAQSFEPIPKGDYLCMAVDSEMKTTKAGTGQYLQIVWEVLDGDYKGRKLWERLNLKNPNQQAVDIAQRTLSSICRAITAGGAFDVMRPKDSAELHGKPLLVSVGLRKREDTGEYSNECKGYKPANGKAPATSTEAKDSKTPPWKR